MLHESVVGLPTPRHFRPVFRPRHETVRHSRVAPAGRSDQPGQPKILLHGCESALGVALARFLVVRRWRVLSVPGDNSLADGHLSPDIVDWLGPAGRLEALVNIVTSRSLDHVVELTWLLLPHLAAASAGTILNVASGGDGAALVRFTEQLAREVRGLGIRACFLDLRHARQWPPRYPANG